MATSAAGLPRKRFPIRLTRSNIPTKLIIGGEGIISEASRFFDGASWKALIEVE